jgi:translation initiation factor IF-2
MINDKGESVKTALPSNAVRLLGLKSLPSSGQEMLSVDSESVAREIAERRQFELESRRSREDALVIRRAEAKARAAAALAAGQEVAADTSADLKVKINVVIKADGVGTLEALKQIVQGIASRAVQDIQICVVGTSIGDVNTSDVELAASGGDALVLAFNVGIADTATRSMAKMKDVNICRDDVIYRLEDELVRTMLSHLPKERSLVREVRIKKHI